MRPQTTDQTLDPEAGLARRQAVASALADAMPDVVITRGRLVIAGDLIIALWEHGIVLTDAGRPMTPPRAGR